MTYLSDHLLNVYYYMPGEWLYPLHLTLLCIPLSVSIHGKWLSPPPLTPLCIPLSVSIHGKWLSPLPLTYLSDHLLTVYHYMQGE